MTAPSAPAAPTAPTAPTATDLPTPAAPAPPDLRTEVHAAQQWVAGLMDGVRPDQLADPTPCADLDVAALLRHLLGVADRLVAMGGGRPASSVPDSVEALPGDVAGTFRERVERGRQAWAEAATLGRLVEAPFGRVPGAVVLGVYLSENLTHGWDLATATGQEPEADPVLVGPAYATMQRALPAEGREGFPFDPPVAPTDGAGPTERLANWLGRVSR